MKNRARYVALILLLIAPIVVAADLAESAEHSRARPRPSYWAKPLEREGLPNLHQVTDTLYRGGQPTTAGMGQLKTMGVRTVINLRCFHSDRDEIGDTGLAYVHIYMKAWHPEEKEVVRFLKIVTDDNRTPAFVHCKHGADRTGLVCAIYRVAICGWAKQEAISEMTNGDFGYHKIWRNLIRFIENLDIAAIKKRAGIED